MLSLQGTVRNMGDPAITVLMVRDGGIEQGKTGGRCLKDSRESDTLIVAMNRRSSEGVSWKFEVGERRGVLGRELYGKTDEPFTEMEYPSTRNFIESRRRLRVTCPEEPDEGKPQVRICEGEWKRVAWYAYNKPQTGKP